MWRRRESYDERYSGGKAAREKKNYMKMKKMKRREEKRREMTASPIAPSTHLLYIPYGSNDGNDSLYNGNIEKYLFKHTGQAYMYVWEIAERHEKRKEEGREAGVCNGVCGSQQRQA